MPAPRKPFITIFRKSQLVRIIRSGGHDAKNDFAFDVAHDADHRIDPRVRLLEGSPVPFAQPFDKSVSALVFIGQHAMAGAKDGILTHTMSSLDMQNWWANGKAIGEIGTWVMVTGERGIPTIMLSGDTAAAERPHLVRPGVEQIDSRTWAYKGQTFTKALALVLGN